MIEVEDVVLVDSRSVACDGGQGPLGHPRVYLAIDKTGEVECPYCSRRFIYQPAGKAKEGETETEEADTRESVAAS